MRLSSVYAIFFSSLLMGATGAPTKLDAKALKQNAEAAQHLNSVFRSMTESTPCSNMQKSCISGSLATCTGGAFQLKDCPSGESCFAVPNTKIGGTTTLCTKEEDAQSAIQAAGGEGGIFGAEAGPKDKDTKSSDGEDNKKDKGGDDEGSGSEAPTSTKKRHHCTVSATPSPTLSDDNTSAQSKPSATITLFSEAETLTLDPAAASSLIASLTSAGASIVTTIAPTASPAGSGY